MKVNSRFKATLAALAIFCLAPVPGVRAQSAAAAAAPPAKIAIISVRNAIIATAEGKQAQATLQSEFAPKQNDLQNTQKQIEDLQQKLNQGARTLSTDEQARMQRQGTLLQGHLQRESDDLNEELTAAQGDLVDNIGRKMLEVIDRYARENGYTVVLDSSAQGGPVVYGSSAIDITQDIVRLYDQANPIKASAAPAAAPPAPKPAASAPAAPAPAPAKKSTQ